MGNFLISFNSNKQLSEQFVVLKATVWFLTEYNDCKSWSYLETN